MSVGKAAFNYVTAFSRNIGWVTEAEQQTLKTKRIAIAGMGGVGGSHLLTLARLGVGTFSIADPDIFELANLNRQAGAVMSTINRPKVEVLADMARDINPEADIRIFPQGVNEENLSDFFRNIDLYVDGLDFFAFDARERVFDYCARPGNSGGDGGATRYERRPAQFPPRWHELRGLFPGGGQTRT